MSATDVVFYNRGCGRDCATKRTAVKHCVMPPILGHIVRTCTVHSQAQSTECRMNNVNNTTIGTLYCVGSTRAGVATNLTVKTVHRQIFVISVLRE